MYGINTAIDPNRVITRTLLNFIFGHTVRCKQTRRLDLVLSGFYQYRIQSALEFVNRLHFYIFVRSFPNKFQSGSNLFVRFIFHLNANVESTLIKNKLSR